LGEAESCLEPGRVRQPGDHANMDAPQPSRLAQALLKPGPEPTGSEKVFDSIYGWLGGLPQNRAMASALTNLFDIGTLGMATGAYEGAKDLARTGSPTTLAMALMPGARVAGPVAKVAEKAAEKGIRAFHGSPHSFDRFDMSKIGTGEGAQAYGHGLYFAENEGVAGNYRRKLSGSGEFLSVDGQPYDYNNLYHRVAAMVHVDGLSPDEIYRRYTKIARNDKNRMFRDEAREIARIAKSGQVPTLTRKAPGHMYEVNIKANPDDFLDWDKPLSQQSEKVREAALGIRNKAARAEYESRGFPEPLIQEYLANAAKADKTGAQVVQGMKGAGQSSDFSQSLREAGIPGIRYLDQGSRSAGEGSRNYVVFDDALIEIMRKYGLLPPAAALGAGLLADDPAQASP